MALTLVLGNKNYSSWSLRPYLALAHHKIPFDEIVIPLYEGDWKQAILKHSPAGKVPVLVDGGTVVWESLAILEYLAEKFPKLALWPGDPAARAHARAISTEMHAGFAALRQACSMNLKRVPRPIVLPPEAVADVERVTQIWNETRARFGKGQVPIWGFFRGRLHVCAGRDPHSHLFNSGRSRLERLCRRDSRAASFYRLARGRAERAVDDGLRSALRIKQKL
jgi:glutathione S-transferase